MRFFYSILFLLPNLLFGQAEYENQRDSLLSITRDATIEDTIIGETYLRLSELYYRHNLDSMHLICQQGILHISNKEMAAAGEPAKKLKSLRAQLINNTGMAFYARGLLDEAVALWYQSLAIREELKDKKGQADLLNNIGNIQLDLGEIEKSRQTFKDILLIQSEIEDSAGIARSYNVLGYIERTNGNDSLALDWYEKALDIRLALNNRMGIATSLNNIGYVYKQNQRYREAIEQYNQANEIYVELDRREGIVAIKVNLANCYFELNEYQLAEKYAQQGYALATDMNSLDDLMHLNEVLYKIHSKKGENESALDYYKNFVEIRDSLDSEKNYRALINQELEYEFQKKEKIAELERIREKELQDLKHESDLILNEERSFRLKLTIGIVSIGLLVVIILFLLILKQLRHSRTQQTIIEQQNVEIEMRALRSQMNPHFLFNSLNSIKHFIIKNESVLAADYLTKFAKLVRLVLENSNHNLISLTNEIETTNYYLELEQLRFKGKFDYQVQGEVNTDLIQIPPLILQPFIENAIWHGILNKAEGQGKIVIQLNKVNNAVQIEISDNGIGREKAKEIKKVSGNENKSMGLALTLDRLETLNHSSGVETKVEIIDLFDQNKRATGTKVIIRIPHYD